MDVKNTTWGHFMDRKLVLLVSRLVKEMRPTFQRSYARHKTLGILAKTLVHTTVKEGLRIILKGDSFVSVTVDLHGFFFLFSTVTTRVIIYV